MVVRPICNRVVVGSNPTFGPMLFFARNDSALNIKAGKAPNASLFTRYFVYSTSPTIRPARGRHTVGADVNCNVVLSVWGFMVHYIDGK